MYYRRISAGMGGYMKRSIVQNYLLEVSTLLRGRERSSIRSWRTAQRPFVFKTYPHSKAHLIKNQFISDATLLSLRGEELIDSVQGKLKKILDGFEDEETKQKIEGIMLPDEELAVILGGISNPTYPRLSGVVDRLMFYNKQLIAAEKEVKRRQSEIAKTVMTEGLESPIEKNKLKRAASPLPSSPEKVARIEEVQAYRKKRSPPLHLGMKKKSRH